MVNVDRWMKAQRAEAEHKAHSSGFTPKDHAISYFEDYWDCEIDTVRGETVLSVGGGTGIIHTLEHPKRQVSVDPLYKNSHVNLDRSDAIIITGCGEKLPLRNDSFDTVISFNVLDHTQSPTAVLNEIHRVLKHDGRFLFAVNTFDVPRVIRDKLDVVDTPHPHHFSTKEMRDMLRDSGFEITHFSSDDRFSEGFVSLLKTRNVRRVGAKLMNIKWCTAVCYIP